MSDTIFIIPSKRDDLLDTGRTSYYVENILTVPEIIKSLNECNTALRDEGPSFILENFATYFSVLHRKVQLDVVYKAYLQLSKATSQLRNSLQAKLQDKESISVHENSQMVNTMKMLIYIYMEFVYYLEEIKRNKMDDLGVKTKGKKDQIDEEFCIDKTEVLNNLSSIIQQEICLFWEPPIVEHDFINMIFELCLSLLCNQQIKKDKRVIMEIFGIFGHLVKNYDCGQRFVTRLLYQMRQHEHLIHLAAEGIKILIADFNYPTLLHTFVREATEWQEDESRQNEKYAKVCSTFLVELGTTMPDLILKDFVHLNKYLAHESAPLRISILSIIYEIIIQVLTSYDLNKKDKEIRDELFQVMLEHFHDISATVRLKVLQNFTKLHKNNAIPANIQAEVLENVIKHMRHKVASVRKAAISSVTVFLECNPYGANLQLDQCLEILREKKELFERSEECYKANLIASMEQAEKEWNTIENDVKEAIKVQLSKETNEDSDDDDDEDEEHETNEEMNHEKAVNDVRNLLEEKKFQDAFLLCKKFNTIKGVNNQNLTHKDAIIICYLQLLKQFFTNKEKIIVELRANAGMTEEDLQKISVLETAIKYYEDIVRFLTILDSSIDPMKELLFSKTISDADEAINFFVVASKFKVSRYEEGLREMLKLMKCPEVERQNIVIEAFKTIYLTSDTQTMQDHTTTVMNGMIDLVKDLDYIYLDEFQCIITTWTEKGILDNNIIDRCWQYYIQRDQNISDLHARIASKILQMAAKGRIAIIQKNINVVTTVMFSEAHRNDLLFFADSCDLLKVAGSEQIDINSEKNIYAIKYNNKLFIDLAEFLCTKFFDECSFFIRAMESAIDVIFTLCSKPIQVTNDILKTIGNKIDDCPTSRLLAIRFCNLLGIIAIKLKEYLDSNIYKELNRRDNMKEEKKHNSKKQQKKNRKLRKSVLNNSSDSVSTLNGSVLMGAEAENTHAEFILNVLENNIVTGGGLLSNYTQFVINICQTPETLKDIAIQRAGIKALSRFMLVSGAFCRQNIRLLFTILERTTFTEIRTTTIFYCADLLEIHPNIVEPWISRVYQQLKSPQVEIRKGALFSLGHLILRDMILVHSHISELAVCLLDEDQYIKEMCQGLFEKLSKREHFLVNALPDIFTHLVRTEEIAEPELRTVLQYLFNLLDKTKRMESLVDRLCCKYTQDQNMRLNRNVTFFLSLINYNEKTLTKLQERFPLYQHHLHDKEIYSIFKNIIANCSKEKKAGKANLKPIATEIEGLIASTFEMEEGTSSRPRAKSSRKGRAARKKNRRASSEDEENDDELAQQSKSSGSKKKTRKTSSSGDDEESASKSKNRASRRKNQTYSSEESDEVFEDDIPAKKSARKKR